MQIKEYKRLLWLKTGFEIHSHYLQILILTTYNNPIKNALNISCSGKLANVINADLKVYLYHRYSTADKIIKKSKIVILIQVILIKWF